MSMGVYIKGMEMPINCHSCPMCFMRFCQAGDRELSEQETRPNVKRPEDCPLVPVPPHGDLIDRDALEYMEMETCDTEDSFRIIERVAGRNRIRKIVRDAPTIIPADPAEEGE